MEPEKAALVAGEVNFSVQKKTFIITVVDAGKCTQCLTISATGKHWLAQNTVPRSTQRKMRLRNEGRTIGRIQPWRQEERLAVREDSGKRDLNDH